MAVEHDLITDPDIHEPKGISAATSDQVYVSDGLGSGDWTTIQDAVFPLQTPVRRCEKIQANIISRPGNVDDADIDVDGTLLFASGSAEYAYFLVSIPTDWVDDSSIAPFVHWAKTTAGAGDVVWDVYYKVYKKDNVGSAAFTLHDEESVVGEGTTDTDSAEKHLITPFVPFDPTSLDLSAGDIFIIRIGRKAADAGDTYAADARLLSFCVSWQIDRIGSI